MHVDAYMHVDAHMHVDTHMYMICLHMYVCNASFLFYSLCVFPKSYQAFKFKLFNTNYYKNDFNTEISSQRTAASPLDT